VKKLSLATLLGSLMIAGSALAFSPPSRPPLPPVHELPPSDRAPSTPEPITVAALLAGAAAVTFAKLRKKSRD
jgi:hypothetical protein